MEFVIVGCGRVGAALARELARSHAVTVVDWSARAFDRLGDEFAGQTVIGNGIDVDVLRSAGVENVDIFFALTDDDNRNLMAAQVARQLGAGRVVARVYDADRSRVFADMGVTTVSPTIKGAERLFAIVMSGEEET
jgi:trk system potassium uptake protein TrkA